MALLGASTAPIPSSETLCAAQRVATLFRICDRAPCCFDDCIRSKAKFFQQIFQRRRRAEAMHPDHFPIHADIALPSKGCSHFDGNARFHRGWKDALLVSLVLCIEEFPRRHAHNTRIYTLSLQGLVSLDAKMHFTAGGE